MLEILKTANNLLYSYLVIAVLIGGGLYFTIRGLFSNEAGLGSAPNAAATAYVSHPVNRNRTDPSRPHKPGRGLGKHIHHNRPIVMAGMAFLGTCISLEQAWELTDICAAATLHAAPHPDPMHI